MMFNPTPKPEKVEKQKMTSYEFQRKYVRKKTTKRKKRKPKKKNPRQTARDRAKASTQKYARLRDARKDGTCKCISCGKITVWNRNTDGGHFVAAEKEATCFDERNINAQCKKCNMQRMSDPSSEVVETYKRNLDRKWGEGTAEDLKIKSHLTVKRDEFDYREIKKYYDKKCKEIQKEKGL